MSQDNLQEVVDTAKGVAPAAQGKEIQKKKPGGRPRRKLTPEEIQAREQELFDIEVSGPAGPGGHSTNNSTIDKGSDNICSGKECFGTDYNELSTKEVDTGGVKFSERELRALENWFSGKYKTKWQAARAAGYKGATKRSLINTLNGVLKKYDSGSDHRAIMRDIGAGESHLIKLLLQLAEGGKDEKTRLGALNILTKCAGLQREVVEGDKGGDIIINVPTGKRVAPQDDAAPGAGGQGKPFTVVK